MMLAIINWYSVNMSPQKYSRRSVWWLLSPSPPKRHWQLLLNLVSATNIISTWMILYTIFNPSPEKEIWNWFPNDVIKRWLCIENFRKFQNYFSCSSLLLSQSPHLSARNSSIIREPHHHHHSPMRRCIHMQHSKIQFTQQLSLAYFPNWPGSLHCSLLTVDISPLYVLLPRTVAVIMSLQCRELAPPTPAWSETRDRRPGPATVGALTMVRWNHKIE